jgi:hypothetical protein
VDHAIAIAFDAADFGPTAQIRFNLFNAARIRPEVNRLAIMMKLFADAAGDVVGGLHLVRCDCRYGAKACCHIGKDRSQL